MDEITKEHSTNTPYHIYVLYKMASVNNMAGKFEDNESVFERITEIAPMAYGDKESLIFMCHNTLLKYYMNYDVDKCCKYGEKLLSNNYFNYDRLSPHDQYDLHHTLGTAYSLEGTSHKQCFKAYEKSIEIAEKSNAESTDEEARIPLGYALNNIGMSKFWYFMEKSRELSQEIPDDRAKLEEMIKPHVDIFEQGTFLSIYKDFRYQRSQECSRRF